MIKYLVIILFITGCSVFSPEPEKKDNTSVVVFQDLLRQGWEIQVVNGKAVLVKQTSEGLLIKDVFGVLEPD